jgi:hypothetical protein
MSDTIYSRSKSGGSSSRRKKRPTSKKSTTDVPVLDKVVVYISQDGSSAAVGCNSSDNDCDID